MNEYTSLTMLLADYDSHMHLMSRGGYDYVPLPAKIRYGEVVTFTSPYGDMFYICQRYLTEWEVDILMDERGREILEQCAYCGVDWEYDFYQGIYDDGSLKPFMGE